MNIVIVNKMDLKQPYFPLFFLFYYLGFAGECELITQDNSLTRFLLEVYLCGMLSQRTAFIQF